MPLKGELRELPLMDLLQILLMNQKTGVLIMEREVLNIEEGGADRAYLYLLGGQVKFIASRGTKSLAELLAGLGYPPPDEPVPLGREVDLLVEVLSSEFAKRPEVISKIKSLIEERMGQLLRWGTGKFLFREAEVPEALSAIDIDSMELIMQGARRVDEWEMVSSKLPSFEVVPALAEELPPGTIHLDPLEWKVLMWVDGERSVRELSDYLPESTFEVAKAVVSMVEKGVLVLRERERAQEEVFPLAHKLLLQAWESFEMEEYDRAEDLATQALALDPDLAVAYLFLAEVYYVQGKYQDAVRLYAEAERKDPSLAKRLAYHIGCAFAMGGNYEFAEASLRRALEEGEDGRAQKLYELVKELRQHLEKKDLSFQE